MAQGHLSLSETARYWLAAAAFIGIYFFNVPFPIIVLSAGVIGYFAGTVAPRLFLSTPLNNIAPAAVMIGSEKTAPSRSLGWQRFVKVFEMSRWLFVSLAIICFPLGALAGPPILTNDTGAPGPGKWETNMGFTVDKRRDTTLYNTPALDLNYGVGDRIQLNYSVSWIMLDPTNGGAKNGIGNSEVAVKWRFLDEDKNAMALSVYPRFIFNNPVSSADRDLVDKGTVFRLPFQMEKKIGIIIINPEIGHDFRQEGGDEWLYALALKYDEIKGIEVLTEVFGTADNSFRKSENVINIGIRSDLSENFTLHASAGRSLRRAPDQPTLLSYVGLQMRL